MSDLSKIIVVIISILIAIVLLKKRELKRIEKNRSDDENLLSYLNRLDHPFMYTLRQLLQEDQCKKHPDGVEKIIINALPFKVPIHDVDISEIVDLLINGNNDFDDFLEHLISGIVSYSGNNQLIMLLKKTTPDPTKDQLESFASSLWPEDYSEILKQYQRIVKIHWIWANISNPPCIKKVLVEVFENVNTMGDTNDIVDIRALLELASKKLESCKIMGGCNSCEDCFKNPKYSEHVREIIREALRNASVTMPQDSCNPYAG